MKFGQKGNFIDVQNWFFIYWLFGYAEVVVVDLCSMMCYCVVFEYFGNRYNCNLAQIEVTGGWVVF